MENLIIFLQTNSGVVVVAITMGVLIFKAGLWMANLDKKIDVNNIETNTKIDNLLVVIQSDSTSAKQRVERLENRFDSGVPLKIKTTKR